MKSIVVPDCTLHYQPDRGVLYVYNAQGEALTIIYGLHASMLPAINLEAPGHHQIAQIDLIKTGSTITANVS